MAGSSGGKGKGKLQKLLIKMVLLGLLFWFAYAAGMHNEGNGGTSAEIAGWLIAEGKELFAENRPT